MRKVPPLIFAALLTLPALAAIAQEKKPAQKPAEPEDVVRVNVELVQTDVMVFDKDGRFVDGLKPEDFQLLVDGKPQPISFFDHVVAGGSRELAALRKARGSRSTQPNSANAAISDGEHGRTILFFVNDIYLAPASLATTHKTINRFFEQFMGPNDQVAITSASGQIGFLQQFTNNRAVLRAALGRLNFVPGMANDHDRPEMGTYAALLISEQRDQQLYDWYVEATMRANSYTELERPIAAALVTQRSVAIVRGSDAATRTALQSLINLMRTTAKIPGRKLVFFISDGFIPNFKGSNFTMMMGNATDAAASGGAVIYSLDARGLTNSSALDAGNGGGFDPSGVVQSRLSNELSFSQEPLHALAADTGGRAFLNSNSLIDGIARALDETSRYYLLAWRPNTESERRPNGANVKVTVAGRPDLKVQVRRGYLGMPLRSLETTSEVKKAKPETDTDQLSGDEHLNVIAENKEDLQTTLALGYKRTSGTAMELTAAIQLSSEQFDDQPARVTGRIDTLVLGAVFDSRGKAVGSFRQRLEVPHTRGKGPASYAIFNYRADLPPGIYQVRTIAKERGSTRLSGAMDWIEIPNLKPGAFSVSSLYVGEITDATANAQVGVQASRRFARSSKMRFSTYIYNAAHSAGAPDLAAQIKVLKGGQPVITPPEVSVKTDKAPNLDNITYAGEFPLSSLSPGQYVLEVTITDRTAKAFASQQFVFTIY